MRVATSPGMSRSSRNTMTLTRNSVGTASATRRMTYGFTRPLLVEPGEGQPHAEPVAVVVAEALHVLRMRHVLRPLRDVHVVRLVGKVALDVVHDLLALFGIHLATLRDEQLRELGVGDPALIGRQLRVEAAVEVIVDLGEGRGGAH